MTQAMSHQLTTETPSDQSPSIDAVDSDVSQKSEREYAWQVASNLFTSFKYAWSGLTYAFQTQRNFRLHVILGSVAITLAIALDLTAVEVAIICLTIGAVLTMELLNTALESVVDLTVRQTYHELAKIAKDCAAGAVLVSALVSILVASSLLLPPVIKLVQSVL